MYRLWYWPDIPGRGEFVRLALEAGGIPYRDCARAGEDVAADLRIPRDEAPFAPPYLVAGGHVIGQTANILYYLGATHGLSPRNASGRLWVNQVQLTIIDAMAEAHDTHHPIDPLLFYEEQQEAALRRAAGFRTHRLPRYFSWFETILARRPGWIGGDTWTYADISLFQLMLGLRYAFPRRVATLSPACPHLLALVRRVETLPELAAYLGSDRRLPFGDGIFRHYPELDAA